MNNKFENPEDDKSATDQSLDEVLQVWGEQRTADDVHLRQRRDKSIELTGLLNEHREEDHLLGDGRFRDAKIDSHVVASSMESGSRFKGLAWAFAVAAVVMLACGLSWSWLNDYGQVKSAGNSIDSEARQLMQLVSSDVEKQNVLLARFREAFGDEFQYVSEVDGEVDIELQSDSGLAVDDVAEFYALKLVVVARNVSDPKNLWQRVHEVNVLTGCEQQVSIPAGDHGLSCSIWAFPVEDELVSVDLECQFDSLLKLSTSELHVEGQVKELLTLTRDGVEYRLYQSLDRLVFNGADGLGVAKSPAQLIGLHIDSSKRRDSQAFHSHTRRKL